MAKFSVDTKLFRELGELLVGRDSTAVVELVKNAYDADARKVTVHGEGLEKPHGLIVIDDNGVGMDADTFARGFLTIAGRTKKGGNERSPLFKRRYTGEKGIGRLAAHKLAADLQVASRKWNGDDINDLGKLPADVGIEAHIDWAAIEALETIDEIEPSGAVELQEMAEAGVSGTKLVLSRARRPWLSSDFRDFFRDVATLVPAAPLTEELSKNVIDTKMLFLQPKVRDTSSNDPGFRIDYSGDFKEQASDLPVVSESAAWVIEIDCNAHKNTVRIAVEPTKAGKRITKFKNAEGWSGEFDLGDNPEAVSFMARIFEKENGSWSSFYRGVRVYQEGFRIPPYGDPYNDWLELDADARSRTKGELKRLSRFSEWTVPEGDPGEGLVVKGNENYFGGVFLTRDGSKQLEMLVNREGFLPSPSWAFVAEVVRWAIGIQIRQKYAASQEPVRLMKEDKKRRRMVAERADEGVAPFAFRARELSREAISLVKEAKSQTAAGDARAAAETLNTLAEVVAESEEITSSGASEAVMYRVLASVGLEQAAFIHEVLGLGTTAAAIAESLKRIAAKLPSGPEQAKVRSLVVDATELRERLRRNGVYLSEMTGVEGRRRRSRLRLRDRFEPVRQFHLSAADMRGVTIDNEIPQNLMSPPIFPAEAAALFSNLVSNAVKFAGSPGQVRATGETTDGEIVIKIENTGAAIDLGKSDRWFEPFQSTTIEVDEKLGQGMGLGLTVSRSLMDEYGGTIEFVKPSEGFSTAIEIRWPNR